MLLAVLMRLQRMSLRAAFTLVHSKRPVVWPNRSFMQQLIACVAILTTSPRSSAQVLCCPGTKCRCRRRECWRATGALSITGSGMRGLEGSRSRTTSGCVASRAIMCSNCVKYVLVHRRQRGRARGQPQRQRLPAIRRLQKDNERTLKTPRCK
jgi:hypothetical protein